MRPIIPWIAAATMLPLFLGGGEEVWVYGLTVAILGMLILASPPRHALARRFNWTFLAMAAVGFTAFLPLRWFGEPPWRTAATQDLGIVLPATLSPQPWVSFHALCLFLFLLLWLYFLTTKEWQTNERARMLKVSALMLLAFAIACIVFNGTGFQPPLWNSVTGFGPFHNRNQTGTVLAMASVLLAVCAHSDFPRHKIKALFWVAGIGVTFSALVLNQSRAGILFFFAGLGLWIGLTSYIRKSVTRVGIAGSLLLAAATVFFLYGGDLLDRLAVFRGQDLASALQDEGRVSILQDTLALIRQSPVAGVGLGNFEPAFAQVREHVTVTSRAHHPESDWLWLTSETGLLGLTVTLILLGMLVQKVTPLSRTKSRRGSQWRAGALVCALILALNACIDVPAHRLGSLLPALLFLAMATHHRRGRRRYAPRLRLLIQGGGVAMILTGSLWALASTRGWILPGVIGAENLFRKATVAQSEGDHAQALALASRAIQYRPLRWEYYYLRAVNAAKGAGTLQEARADFRIARFLEPTHADLPYQEARFWLSVYPPYALPAIHETLQRKTHRGAGYYIWLLQACKNNLPMLRALGRLSDDRSDFKTVYLTYVPPDIFNEEIKHIINLDPLLSTYSTVDQRKVFDLWARRGDREELMVQLSQKPTWQKAGWRLLASFYAEHRDYQAAFVTAIEQLSVPTLPQFYASSSTASLRAAFFSETENADPTIGLRLYQMEVDRGNTEEAYLFLEKVSLMPDCPPYVFYFIAKSLYEKGEFEKAWSTLSQYIRLSES